MLLNTNSEDLHAQSVMAHAGPISPMYSRMQADGEVSIKLRGQTHSTLVPSGTLRQVLNQDLDKLKVNNSFDMNSSSREIAHGHMRQMSMQHSLNLNKMSSSKAGRNDSDARLHHINTSGASNSRIESAERHRSLWPNIQDQINKQK